MGRPSTTSAWATSMTLLTAASALAASTTRGVLHAVYSTGHVYVCQVPAPLLTLKTCLGGRERRKRFRTAFICVCLVHVSVNIEYKPRAMHAKSRDLPMGQLLVATIVAYIVYMSHPRVGRAQCETANARCCLCGCIYACDLRLNQLQDDALACFTVVNALRFGLSQRCSLQRHGGPNLFRLWAAVAQWSSVASIDLGKPLCISTDYGR